MIRKDNNYREVSDSLLADFIRFCIVMLVFLGINYIFYLIDKL